jgi:hypothetical protein
MKKLNSIVYNKLMLQADEAREQNLEKLADGITSSIELDTKDFMETYSSFELDQDIYTGIWKLATNVLKYHNVNSVDAVKLHSVIQSLSSSLINNVSKAVDVDPLDFGPLELKTPGEI